MMGLLLALISSFGSPKLHFRPTDIYNENWPLKLGQHEVSRMPVERNPRGFLPLGSWFSEALLPIAFKARYQGDPLSESRTNADGVISISG